MQQKNVIKVIIKTLTNRQSFDVSEDDAVKDLKSLVAVALDTVPDNLILVFAGKILKDDDILKKCNICNNLTVHLVMKKPPVSATTQSQATGVVSLNQDALGSVVPRSNALNNMLRNNILQRFIDDPDFIPQLVAQNPHLQQSIERSPCMRRIFNNPVELRRMLTIMRSPSLLNEYRRLYDRALLTLESMPHGFEALHRNYRATEQRRLSFFLGPLSCNSVTGAQDCKTSKNCQQGLENRSPLPNPWTKATNNTDTLLRNVLFLNNLQRLKAAPQLTPQPDGAPNTNADATNDGKTATLDLSNFRNNIMNLLNKIFYNTEESQSQTQPEGRHVYELQLEQLNAMGFGNRAVNIQALDATLGNVNAAINLLDLRRRYLN